MEADEPISFNKLLNSLLMLPERNKDYTYEDAIRLTRFALYVNPDAAVLHFNLASFYSAVNNIEDSLYYLEGALKKGFCDWEKLTQDESLGNTRRTIRCWEIIYKHFKEEIPPAKD